MRSRFGPLAFLLYLVVAALIADRVVAAGLHAVALRSGYRLSRLYAGAIGADAVVLGNSRAVHMVDVRALGRDTGLRVYSLALNGVDTATEGAVIQDYLDRNPPPKIALVEVSNLTLAQSSAGQYALYRRDSPRLAREIAAHDGALIPWRALFSLYDMNGQTLWRCVAFLGRRDDQNGPLLNAHATPDVVSAYLAHAQHMGFVPAAAPPLKVALDSLERRGVRVVAIIAPYHPAVRGVVDHAALASSARLALGRPVLDLSEALGGRRGLLRPAAHERRRARDLAAGAGAIAARRGGTGARRRGLRSRHS